MLKPADNLDETPDSALDRQLRWGIFFWLAFCILMIALRGVQWDESYEDARIFLGQIHYPVNHPTYIFLHNSFSGQTYAATALWRLWPNLVFFNGLHNVLFLASAVVPAFLLGARLARRAVAGHVAALLILLHVHVSFDNVYPLMVFPGVFSYGQVGTAWALLALCAIMTRRMAVAGLMLGVMPCVHLGQLPQLLPLAGLALVVCYWRGERRAWTSMLAGGLGGLAITAAFWLIVQRFAVPLPASGPYAFDAETAEAWRTFIAYYDPHRRVPIGPNDGNGHLALIVAMLLTAGAAWTEWRSEKRMGPRAALAVYAFTVAAIIYGTIAVQCTLGPSTPFVFTAWIPYRLINHAALILTPLTIALLCGAQKRNQRAYVSGAMFVGLVLLFEVVKPVFGAFAQDTLYKRYIEPGDGVFLALCGAAFAAQLRAFDHARPRMVHAALGLITLGVVGWIHHFGAACAVAGFAVMQYLLHREVSHANAGALRGMWLARPAIAYVCCAVLLLTMTYGQWRQRTTLPLSEFDRAVTRYLAEQGQDSAILLGGPADLIFPTRTGHCSIGDADAIKIAYMPSLFSAQVRIFADLYGIHYDQRPTPGPSWQERWTARTPEEWQALANTYQFSYVYAPVGLTLQLPCVLREPGGSLYRIVEKM
ncbi:MAG: hypothetical protein HZB26_04185 [Candidatus Hydrogenedentes bacterium]|nr:hypothetical protein [Candidatus Hydrogenedentota bacterium]